MKKFSYSFPFFMLFCCNTLIAADQDKPPEQVQQQVEASQCTKEELMTFFPKAVVKSVLIQHKVPEAEAQIIAQELSQKDQEVVKTVEMKASKLDPNPFKDLSNRDMAVKVFRESLFEVFSKVMKAHNITDESQIKALLEDLQATKGKLFVECIKKGTPPPVPAPANKAL